MHMKLNPIVTALFGIGALARGWHWFLALIGAVRDES
jgi:hypothetical protein